MTKDLTRGNPFVLIVRFSIPVLCGILFQNLYAVADAAIVGKIIGVEALAAVGATGSISFLIIGCCSGICSGFAIPIAQKFGAKDYRTMRQLVAMSVVLSAAFACVITVVTAVFCRPLLVLMQTPDDIIDYSCRYIRIIFYGIPVCFLYNLASGILRAVGDSRTPLIFLSISIVVNIFLDVFFIVVLKSGVAGAALASVIAEGLAGVMCLVFIRCKVPVLHVSRNDCIVRPQHFATLAGMGVPMGLQYSVTAIGSVIVQWSVNQLGSDAVASVAAAMKIHILFCAPFDAFGTAMATFGGQNTGARAFSRLKTGCCSCLAACAVYSIAAAAVMFFAGRSMSLLFLDPSQSAIIDGAHRYLIINSLFYIPLAVVNIVRFLIQGMGFSNLAIVSGIFEMVARAAVGIVFVPLFGFTAACCASPAAWVLADCFLLPAFAHCYRTLSARPVTSE